MQIFLVLLLCVTCVNGDSKLVQWFSMLNSDTVKTHFSSYLHEWLVFKKDYGKSYEDVETEFQRFETFKSNLQYIVEHNKLYVLGNKSFYLGINQFADMTQEEFRRQMNLDKVKYPRPTGESDYDPPATMAAPDMVDWRTKGYVTAVKNQGSCGSCWAFSTTGAMEGFHFKKTGKLIPLSEQQLMDCTRNYGEQGCNGGFVNKAFQYIHKYGIESEGTYSYKTKQSTCKYDPSQVVANCSGFKYVTKGSETALKLAVTSQGPVSVAIDANHRSFQYYKGGVYNEPACSSVRLDHAVLVVGYGIQAAGGDYWIVKNSWGTSWGASGYVMMSRNKNNQCGIASDATFPV